MKLRILSQNVPGRSGIGAAARDMFRWPAARHDGRRGDKPHGRPHGGPDGKPDDTSGGEPMVGRISEA